MIPKATNQSSSKKELNAARLIAKTVDPLSLSMDMVGFYISTLPADEQIRFIDLIIAYVNTAKNSEHDMIKAWARSFSESYE